MFFLTFYHGTGKKQSLRLQSLVAFAGFFFIDKKNFYVYLTSN
jgi:hypothetical protein